MALTIYNTLTKKKEVFTPRKGKNVDMFVCGPTVYNYIHIGNARTYTVFDMIVNYMRLQGYKVKYIQNITDLDDKIIKRAGEEKKDPLALAKEYAKIYFEDMKKIPIVFQKSFLK